ncbi:unnamed protein product [Lampetra fluviatilis]
MVLLLLLLLRVAVRVTQPLIPESRPLWLNEKELARSVSSMDIPVLNGAAGLPSAEQVLDPRVLQSPEIARPVPQPGPLLFTEEAPLRSSVVGPGPATELREKAGSLPACCETTSMDGSKARVAQLSRTASSSSDSSTDSSSSASNSEDSAEEREVSRALLLAAPSINPDAVGMSLALMASLPKKSHLEAGGGSQIPPPAQETPPPPAQRLPEESERIRLPTQLGGDEVELISEEVPP